MANDYPEISWDAWSEAKPIWRTHRHRLIAMGFASLYPSYLLSGFAGEIGRELRPEIPGTRAPQ
jgi:hypothetical protein